jgi:ATP-binding cassette subfamily C protein
MMPEESSAIPRPTPALYRRCKTPTVIQMEATECGAAALCMILGYYGSYIPLEDVRVMCSVSRDGSNAFKMLRAAEHYGLKAEGYSSELKDLYTCQLPFIAFWNFDHFVVVEGFSKTDVYINDPASGPRQISYEELNESFTGIILTFTPIQGFQPSTLAKNKWWPLLWKRFKLFRWPILYSLLIGLFAIIPALALTVLSQVFVDNVLIAKLYSWKWGIFSGMAIVTLFATAIHFLQAWIFTRFSINLSTLLSSQFVWHTLRLPILFFRQRYGGEIATRISLNEAVGEAWVERVLPAIINVCFAIIFALVMFYYDIWITLTGIAIVLINLILMRRLYRSREDAYANYKQIQGRMASFAISGLESIESLKAVGGEYQFIARLGGIYTKSLNTLQNMARTDMILGTFSPFFHMLGSMTVLMLGSLRIINGHLTVGEFLALQMLFNFFTTPVLNLVNINQTLQLLRIDLYRVDDVLRHPLDPLWRKRTMLKQLDKIDRLQGSVEVKNLSFGFSPLDPPLLENINLSLAAGECIALVGPSGSGKSTLIALIGGLFVPREGEILLDGVSNQNFPREVINRSIAVVEQFPYLFNDSIQQNLSLMDPLPDQKAVIQAAQDACIHEEIMSRPKGYQSLIEKEGSNFSGGQRQRLEIACALYRTPSILILDEATSAVDSLTEKQIIDNIRRRGQTSLIVTHRLSAIRDCDKIFVMDKGKIVQEGTHEELVKQTGVYRSLVYTDDFASHLEE